MDHRVSKDMISSGMTPSGEKTQADLGRTQYGSAPSPNKLMDAYKSMYEKKEEVINEHHKKDVDGNTIPHEGEEIEEGAGLYANIHAKRKRGGKMRKKGEKGAPSSQDFANAARTAKEEVEVNEVAPILAAPLVAKGLMALKGAKLGAAALKGAAAFKKGLTTAKAVGAAGKITTSGGKLAAGAQKVGMAQKAGQSTRSGLAAMKNNPMATYIGVDAIGSTASAIKGGKSPAPQSVQPSKVGRRTAGMYNDVDLFDIVKGQLLDEGLNEKEVTDVMTTLTLEEINEVIQINEISAALLKRASKAAEVARGKAAVAGNTELAKKKLAQGQKFSSAMKQKNLATSRAENMRKPTGPMANRPQPDPTRPYPGTPR